jgi:hypothetical protein
MDMDKIWQWFAIIVIATLIGVGVYGITAPKHVVRYELGAGYEGLPAIHVDIENSSDETIRLSKDVTWQQAVQMIDSLNQNLRKHRIQ